MASKKSLLIGAAVATVSLGGLGSAGLASAAETTTSSQSSNIVDKLASKFNLNKAEVTAVFDEDKSARQAERKADHAERLAAAVSDSTITQAQADYVTSAQADIEALRESVKESETTDKDAAREQLKPKMDALRSWADENDIDKQFIGGGHGDRGGFRGDKS
jgi:polyhydroxyalkanoate synthesis regulator phasin